MALDPDAALTGVLARGDEWRSWRALRLLGEATGPAPAIVGQDELGGFIGPNGQPSPAATGEGLCHLALLGLGSDPAGVIAADWLLEARTPAAAWLDAPDQVPGELDEVGGARVYATAAAACGLTCVGRDPGERAVELIRGEADQNGRLTGGAYPTFAAAGAFWLSDGPETEMAEWALRWARETDGDWWGPWERATALTFWGAAGIPAEHPSVDVFLETLSAETPAEGRPDDIGLTIRTLELLYFFGQWRPN